MDEQAAAVVALRELAVGAPRPFASGIGGHLDATALSGPVMPRRLALADMGVRQWDGIT